MGLDLWFREDVARILAAAWETMQATAEGTWRGTVTAAEDRVARAYERGFEDALRAVGVAFGLSGGGGRRWNEIPQPNAPGPFDRRSAGDAVGDGD